MDRRDFHPWGEALDDLEFTRAVAMAAALEQAAAVPKNDPRRGRYGYLRAFERDFDAEDEGASMRDVDEADPDWVWFLVGQGLRVEPARLSASLRANGLRVFRSPNGVLLARRVPAACITDVAVATARAESQRAARELKGRADQAIGYIGWSMLGLGGIALFASTRTDSPLAASLATLAAFVGSQVLDLISATQVIQPYLPTHYWLKFVDFYRDPILWRDIVRGIGLQVVYVGVFLGAAWANFTTKDVTS